MSVRLLGGVVVAVVLGACSTSEVERIREPIREAQATSIPASFRCDYTNIRFESDELFADIDVNERTVEATCEGGEEIFTDAELRLLDEEALLLNFIGDRIVLTSEAMPFESAPMPFKVQGEIVQFGTNVQMEFSEQGTTVTGEGSSSGTLNMTTGAFRQTGEIAVGSADIELEIDAVCAPAG